MDSKDNEKELCNFIHDVLDIMRENLTECQGMRDRNVYIYSYVRVCSICIDDVIIQHDNGQEIYNLIFYALGIYECD